MYPSLWPPPILYHNFATAALSAPSCYIIRISVCATIVPLFLMKQGVDP